jgi:hypothetical protein
MKNYRPRSPRNSIYFSPKDVKLEPIPPPKRRGWLVILLMTWDLFWGRK